MGAVTAQLSALGADETLRIKTFDKNGNAIDRPFHLKVSRVRR